MLGAQLPPLDTHMHTVTHTHADVQKHTCAHIHRHVLILTHVHRPSGRTYMHILAREVLLGASFWSGHLCSLFAIHFMAVGAGSALEWCPGSCTHTGLETLKVTSSQVSGLRISSLFSTSFVKRPAGARGPQAQGLCVQRYALSPHSPAPGCMSISPAHVLCLLSAPAYMGCAGSSGSSGSPGSVCAVMRACAEGLLWSLLQSIPRPVRYDTALP